MLLSARTLHPALPGYLVLILVGLTPVSWPVRAVWRSPRPVRRSLSLLAELLRQPWPALAAVMLVVGLLTPLVFQVPWPDALFAGQATAILVPMTRLEMRPELTHLLR
jgi:hypothetical protein